MRWEALSPWWPDFVFWCWGFVVNRWVYCILWVPLFEGFWLLRVFQFIDSRVFADLFQAKSLVVFSNHQTSIKTK
jgi:hypothetical protein